MTDYVSLPTLTGKQKIADAVAGTAALHITQMAVGDGAGAPVTPLETQAALVREVWRGAVTSVTRDVSHPNQVVVVATIPLEAGPFMIRELGLYDQAGSLIAVASHPQVEKTALSQGTGQTLDVTFILVVDTAAQLTIILENRPQSDWAETDTQSLAYIKNKPVIPGIPNGIVFQSRKIETRKGLTGGGDLGSDRIHDIEWANLPAATGLNASDLIALKQAAQGNVAADHRSATLLQLANWIIAGINFPAAPAVAGLVVKKITQAQYEYGNVTGTVNLVGIAAGTSASVEVVRSPLITTGNGYKRRISFMASGVVTSGATYGEQSEIVLDRTTDNGATWAPMAAGTVMCPPIGGAIGGGQVGGTVMDLLDDATHYRVSARSLGDSSVYVNHVRIIVEEMGNG